MVWKYVQRKVKNSLYPDLYLWSHNIPRTIRTSIYKKHGLNVRFEIIPERWPPMLYFWYFGKKKGWHYPTDDDIKWFYFTLFKKNGFIFMIICYIFYRNCFLELIILVIKSAISFYLIVYFIYMILFLRKIIRLSFRMLVRTPLHGIPTLIIYAVNAILNMFNPKNKKKWYF